jgi:hypothetical protein
MKAERSRQARRAAKVRDAGESKARADDVSLPSAKAPPAGVIEPFADVEDL